MDAASFAGSKDPFGAVNFDPSRDFFQPTTSFGRPPAPQPAVAPPVVAAPLAPKPFWQRHFGAVTAAAIVLALLAAAAVMCRSRIAAALSRGPFHAEIVKVANAERRDDLHELHHLWRLCRRSAVKDMLGDTLKSAVQSEAAPQAASLQGPPPGKPPPAAESSADDPFFTAA